MILWLCNQARSSNVTFRGFMFQISLAYSWIVRSLLNLPVLKAFRIDFLVHSVLLRYAWSTYII